MALEDILKLISAILVFVTSALIPSLIGLINNAKKYKAAKTEKEKAEAKNGIVAEIKTLVQGAETTYKQLDLILKQQGSSAGPMKKRDVMNALKAFCLENGFEWNEEEVSKMVEDEVAYTKTVNSK